MKVSIQAHTGEEFDWDAVPPVLHDVKDWAEAVIIAYGISKQLGCISVRMVAMPEGWNEKQEEISTRKLIGNLSGSYFQSRP